jgi:hypothetical protein
MMTDDFVKEIHAVRRAMMEECGNDIEKLGELIKRSQKENPKNLVSEVPRTEPEPAATGEE